MNDLIKQKYDELTDITSKFLQRRNLDKNKEWKWDYPLAADEAGKKQEFQTALSQNMDDLKKVIMDFYAYCCKENLLDDFVTCFAMYCNHYIKYGLTCLSEDTEGTIFGLQKADFTNSGDETLLPYLEEIWLGIKTQQYSHFENALSINNNFSAAHLYLFTKKAEIYFWFAEYMNKIQNYPLNLYRNIILKIGEKGFEFFSPVYDSPNESVQENLTEIDNILDDVEASYEKYYNITYNSVQQITDFCTITSDYANKMNQYIINSYHKFRNQDKQTDFLIFFCQCLREINSYASAIEKDLNPLFFQCFRSYFLFSRNMTEFEQTINVNNNELICHIKENDFDASDFSRLKLFTFIVSDETFQVWIKLNANSEETKKEILQEIYQYSSSPEENFKAKIRDRYYSNMIQHYKQLPPSYQEYALSLGKYYQDNISSTTGRSDNSPFGNLNALPHIYFRDWTDIYSEHIVNLSETFDKKYTLTYPEEKKKDLKTIAEKVENGIPLTEEEATLSQEINNQNPEYKVAFTKFTIDLAKAIEKIKKSMQNVPDITIKSPFDCHAKEMVDRVHYLNLYRMVHFGTGQQELKELFDISMRLEQRNEELEQAQKEKSIIINDFSHTYANMRATTLQDIGTKLCQKNSTAFKKWGRQVLMEYTIKENLTKDVELLKLQFENDSDKLIEKIKSSVSIDSFTATDVRGVVAEALHRCFMTLLYDENNSNKGICKLFFGTEDYQEEKLKLREKFEENVLTDKDKIFKWLADTGYIELALSGNWEGVYFNNGGYAQILLVGWLSELFMNVLKYADKKLPVLLEFSKKDVLCITLHNYKNQTAANFHGSRNGVNALERAVKRLNKAVSYHENAIELNLSDTEYLLRIQLSPEILI